MNSSQQSLPKSGRVVLLIDPSQVRMIELCENEGLLHRVTPLESAHYLFVFETDGAHEVEKLFQISQFEHDDNIGVERMFDILDRIYALLVRQWDGWTVSE